MVSSHHHHSVDSKQKIVDSFQAPILDNGVPQFQHRYYWPTPAIGTQELSKYRIDVKIEELLQGESKKSVISKNMAITALKSFRKGKFSLNATG